MRRGLGVLAVIVDDVFSHKSHARSMYSVRGSARVPRTSQLTAVFSCIREVSSVPDDDGIVVDGVSTVSNITQVSDLRFHWCVRLARVYEFLTVFSVSEDVLRVVDETREDGETKHWPFVSPRKVVSPGSRRTSRSSMCSQILGII